MGIPIVRAKISPPELRQDHLFRPALIQGLNAGRTKKLTTVIAGAGYGKSSLLAEWVRSLPEGVRYTWYSLDPADQDPAVFFVYLIAALRELWPGFGQAIESTLSRPVPVNLGQTALLLLGELEVTIKDQAIVIILDDYHRLGNPADINTIILQLLERLPKNIHLAISSRQPVSFPVARLRVDGQIHECTANDLRFGAEEARQLLQQESLPATLMSLIERTEGWIAGLHLIRQAFAQSQPVNLDQIFAGSDDWMRGIFDYLAEEIFEKQPDQLQAFLLQSSILDTLTAVDCDLIFERGDSARWLSYLVSNGLYTVLLGRNPETYRYHHLLADFLSQKLMREVAPAQVSAWHVRAAEHYRARLQWNDAFKHAIQADKALAVETLLQAGPTLRFNAQITTLQNWLDQFSPDECLAHPVLYSWQGFLWEDQGQHEKARGAFQQAIDVALPQQDRRSLYSGWVGLGIVYQRTGELAKSLQAWEQAVEYTAQEGTPAEQVTALNGLALVHLYSGQNPQALDIHRRCLQLSVNLTKPMHALVMQNIGTVLTYMGEFVEALHWYEEALKLREEAKVKPGIANALNNIARVLVLRGDLEAADNNLAKALDIYRQINDSLTHSYALSNLGELALAQGNLEMAEQLYQQSIAIKEQQHDSLGLIHTWALLSELRRLQGDTGGAEFYAKQALDPGIGIAGVNEEILAQTALALAWLDKGEIHAAVDPLSQVIDRHRNLTHNHYQLARCLWYLAHAQFGRDQDGRAPLAEALALGERWDYDFLITRLARELPQLLGKAVAYDLQPAFVTRVIRRLGDEIVPELSKLSRSPDSDVSIRAIKCMADLVTEGVWIPLAQSAEDDPDERVREAARFALNKLQRIPPPPLRVTTLGRFTLQVGDRAIMKAEWGSNRKAQAVFKLLLSQASQPITREKLIDLLWPEAGRDQQDKAIRSLNQAVYQLRKVLEPYLPPRFPSRYVVGDNETYCLELPPGSWIDDQALEEAIKNARKARRLDDSAEMIRQYQTAVDLYQGEYLVEESRQDWPLVRQDRLRLQVIEALEPLGTYYLDHDDPSRAAELAHRLLRAEVEHEPGYWLLMCAQYSLGQLKLALRTYRQYLEKCCKELDVPPSEEIYALYRNIRKELRKSS